MAPEVVNSYEYNQQCDIWSVGVVLYVILSGQFPFHGTNKEETIRKINNQPIAFSSNSMCVNVAPVWTRVSSEGKDLIKRLLEHDYKKRPTAAEALEDPWMKKFSNNEEEKKDQIFIGLRNLESFVTQMTFQKAVLAYVASQQLTNVEEEKLKDSFNFIDTNRNGIDRKSVV